MSEVAARITPDVRQAATRQDPALVLFEGLQPCPRLTRISLRGAPAALAAALAPAGLPISPTPCRAVRAGACTALWLGPDEQLLLTPEAQGTALVQRLTSHLAAVPHAQVDVSQRQVAFEITGPTARTLLATGCPLDLRDGPFPIDMCTRTLYDKSEIVLWRCAESTFHVEVARSFAPYVTALLALAAGERGG